MWFAVPVGVVALAGSRFVFSRAEVLAPITSYTVNLLWHIRTPSPSTISSVSTKKHAISSGARYSVFSTGRTNESTRYSVLDRQPLVLVYNYQMALHTPPMDRQTPQWLIRG